MGQSENDMKVGDGQQFGGTVFQPALASCCLAFWAMPIQARVIGDGSLSATVTLFDVPTEGRGTASGNGTQDFEVETGYPAAIELPICNITRLTPIRPSIIDLSCTDNALQ